MASTKKLEEFHIPVISLGGGYDAIVSDTISLLINKLTKNIKNPTII